MALLNPVAQTRKGVPSASLARGAIAALLAVVLATSLCPIAPSAAYADNASGTVSQPELNRTPMAGSTVYFSLHESYTPPQSQFESFEYMEDWSAKWKPENFTVSSSDENVVSAYITEGMNPAELSLEFKSAGTATITIDYNYVGSNGTYTGSCSFDLTVASETNGITSISASTDTYTIPIVSECAICGKSHGWMSGDEVTLDITSGNGGMLTSDVDIMFEAADPSIVGIMDSANQLDENSFGFNLNALSVGSTTVTFTAIPIAESNPATKTITVNVVEAAKPTVKVNAQDASIDSLYIGASENLGGGIILNRMADSSSVFVYEECDYLRLINNGNILNEGGGASWVNELQFAMGDVNSYYWDDSWEQQTVEVGSYTVEDESVFKITNLFNNYYAFPLSEGSTNITYTDIWGNEVEGRITVKNYGQEAIESYSLSQEEITIEVGEVVNLLSLIEGEAANDYFIFKSADKSIASTHNYDATMGIHSVLGKTVGDVTITAGVLNSLDGDYGGGDRYLDFMETADFDTITIHVVEASEKTPAFDIDTQMQGKTINVEALIAEEEDRLALESQNAKLVASESGVDAETLEAAIDTVYPDEEFDILGALSVNLENSATGETVYPEGFVILRIPLTDEMKEYGTSLKLFQYNPEFDYCEDYGSWVEGGYLHLMVSYFDDFIIAGAPNGISADADLEIGTTFDESLDSSKLAGAGLDLSNNFIFEEFEWSNQEALIRFSQSQLSEDVISGALEEELSDSQKVLLALDIALYVDDVQTEVSGEGYKYQFRIPLSALPSEVDPQSLAVYYVAANGSSYETIDKFRVEGDYLYFTTTHLSDYVVAGSQKQSMEPDPTPSTVAIPEAKTNLVYTGSQQIGVASGEGYSLSGTTSATFIGAYEAVATLNDGYTWSDGTTEPKIISWAIGENEAVNACDSFPDLDPDAWYATFVDYAVEAGLMSGFEDGTFRQGESLTRAQIASMLYKASRDESAGTNSGFTDVAANDWYAEAVTWAASAGVVSGYEDGSFRPNNKVTRQELAVMVMKYQLRFQVGPMPMPPIEYSANVVDPAETFADWDNVASWAKDAVAWCVAEGIISGMPSGDETIVAPESTATRAQAATIIAKVAKGSA